MFFNTILSTRDLMEHLDDPGWLLFDCRTDLANPDWGFSEYRKSHIPRAIYADLNRDLSSPRTEKSGRHPLPDPAEWMKTLSRWGVTADKQVVLYDTTSGSFAVRMWWMLRWVGHSSAAVLDGGLPLWVQEGRPVEVGIAHGQPAVFHGQVHNEMAALAGEVDRIRSDPGFVLLDARAPIRYRGEVEPIDPVAGRIPGALNRYHEENLGADGKMLPPETLREQYARLLHGVDPSRTVVYCGSGVTSCHNILAMEIAGLPGARLYPGSWSEWIRDPNHPVAKG